MNICNLKIINKGLTDKITKAYDLKKKFGDSLLQNKDFRDLLIKLDEKIENTRKKMIEIGVVKECADCAVNGEGTCCSERTAYKCDSIILLINLLLGITFPSCVENPHLCFFLTKHGCLLRARPVICVNYICNRLRNNIPHKQLVHLQNIAGEEITVLFMIEEFIKKKIQASL